jgi:glutathione S-transferase
MSQLERSGSGTGLMQAATRSRRRWRATRAADTSVCGDRPSIADICLVAHLTSAKMLCDSDPGALSDWHGVSTMPACRSRHSRWSIRCGRRVHKGRRRSKSLGMRANALTTAVLTGTIRV